MNRIEDLVSVIVPTYNRQNLLIDCIDSVLSQTYQKWELIIIDDGSTDETYRVLVDRSYLNQSRIRYIRKKNGGCASARNLGISVSIGNYICFLDSDDLFMPRKLETEIELLRENKHNLFAYSDSIEFNLNKGLAWIARVSNFKGKKNFSHVHFSSNHARPGAIMYRSEIFSSGLKFDESFPFNEDSHLLQKISLMFPGIYSDYPGLLVRAHDGSKSRNLIEIASYEMKSALKIVNEYPLFFEQNQDLVKRRLRYIATKIFIASVLNKQLKRALQSIFIKDNNLSVYSFISLIGRRLYKSYVNITSYKFYKKNSVEAKITLKNNSMRFKMFI